MSSFDLRHQLLTEGQRLLAERQRRLAESQVVRAFGRAASRTMLDATSSPYFSAKIYEYMFPLLEFAIQGNSFIAALLDCTPMLTASRPRVRSCGADAQHGCKHGGTDAMAQHGCKRM